MAPTVYPYIFRTRNRNALLRHFHCPTSSRDKIMEEYVTKRQSIFFSSYSCDERQLSLASMVTEASADIHDTSLNLHGTSVISALVSITIDARLSYLSIQQQLWPRKETRLSLCYISTWRGRSCSAICCVAHFFVLGCEACQVVKCVLDEVRLGELICTTFGSNECVDCCGSFIV